MSNSKPKNYHGRIVDMRRIPYYHRVGPLLTNLREDIYKSLIKLGFTIELASSYSNTPMVEEPTPPKVESVTPTAPTVTEVPVENHPTTTEETKEEPPVVQPQPDTTPVAEVGIYPPAVEEV